MCTFKLVIKILPKGNILKILTTCSYKKYKQTSLSVRFIVKFIDKVLYDKTMSFYYKIFKKASQQ